MFFLLTTVGDGAGACLPVLVEGFDRIAQRLSRGDKKDIHIKCGVGFQRRDDLSIPIDFIAFFAIGAVSPAKVHRHGAAANNWFTSIVIGGSSALLLNFSD